MTPNLTSVLDPEVASIVTQTRGLVNRAHGLSTSIQGVLDDLTDHVGVVETERRERRHTVVEVSPSQERRRA